MRLKAKLSFAFLLLTLALGADVALSIWSIRFIEHEFARPLDSVQSVMGVLYEIKRDGAQEIELLRGGDAQGQDAPGMIGDIVKLENQVQSQLDGFAGLPTISMRSGISTVENLRRRSEQIRSTLDGWNDQPDRDALIRMIEQRNALIERINGQILADAKLASDFGSVLQRRIYTIIFVSSASVLVLGFLLLTLIRRWLLVPIGHLHEGTLRLAAGDFEHVIPISTKDEFGDLGHEFNRMGRLVRDMQQREIEQQRLAAMGEMAQRIVHNLRTPMAGIRALAETTADELDEMGVESDLGDLQHRIMESVDRFDDWLQGLLRTSSPLVLSKKSFDFGALIDSVIETHRDIADSKQVTIGYENHLDGQSVLGDPEHLEQALTALISNAVSFADPGSEIMIELRGDNDGESGRWVLRISNDGPMIPADLHHSIFRPYFTTRPSGTGIGLALVKRVIEQHSGRIRVESPIDDKEQTGCAFVIEVPTD